MRLGAIFAKCCFPHNNFLGNNNILNVSASYWFTARSANPLFCTDESARYNIRAIRGGKFYKRRPHQLPKIRRMQHRKKWLEMKPHRQGICEKVYLIHVRKPSSGLARVAMVRLDTGRRVRVYIPGEGHNLNVHSVVLIKGGRRKPVPGTNYKAIRGVFDLLPVKGRMSSRSKYGVKMTTEMKDRKEKIKYNRRWVSTLEQRQEFNELKWPTWKTADGSILLEPLKDGEDVPEPKEFSYQAKFIRWLKENRQ